MMSEVDEKPRAETGRTVPVELVGGPKCGAVIQWPELVRVVVVEYQFGKARYRYQCDGKGIYIGG